MTNAEQANRAQRRRRRQFSLRTLLILVAVAPPVGAWTTVTVWENIRTATNDHAEIIGFVDIITLECTDSVVAEYLQAPARFTPNELRLRLGNSVFGPFRCSPDELRFTCARSWDDDDSLARLLACKQPEARFVAAWLLWQHRSRRYAHDVIQWAATHMAKSRDEQRLISTISKDLRPASIRREIAGGELVWGAWLAAQHPHPTLLAPLFRSLDKQPTAEAIFALGAAKDRQAVNRLVQLLSSKDPWYAGLAAEALGKIGDRVALPHLIKAVQDDQRSPYLTVHACWALGRIGTSEALPDLRRIVQDESYESCALSVTSTAKRAIALIEAREARR